MGMTKIPPLLPSVTLARVLRIARFDGTGALILGGLFAISAGAARHFPFAAIGLLGAGAGAVELHGVALLRQGERRGVNWLVASQPFLLVVMLSYCALRLWLIAPEPLPESVLGLVAASAAQWKMSVDEYVLLLNRITMITLAVAAVAFQGGMMWYYLQRRRPVQDALAEGLGLEEEA
jgi:hypothetical protein